jgi:hypothetical protein
MSYARFNEEEDLEAGLSTSAPVAVSCTQFGDEDDSKAGRHHIPSIPATVSLPPPVVMSDKNFDEGDLEAGRLPISSIPSPTHTPPTLSFVDMLRTLVAMIGRRLACVLAITLFIIPIVTAFSRLVIMKMVTGHTEIIPLIVGHLVYTICTGVLTNMVTVHYAEFITNVMYATLSTVQELYEDILPVNVEFVINTLDKNKDAVKNAISLFIKMVMVLLTVFITVLDSLNIYVIIVPLVNLANIIVIRRLTKKPEEGKTSVLPYINKECNGLCSDCQAICNGRCRIIRDLKKSIWTSTLLNTVTWIPDVICISFFTYSGSTSALTISYMYSSWMIRDTITFAFKVMDDKTRPIHLVKQMLIVCSYLSDNQVSLRNKGVKLTKNITELHVEDYECPHGKVSFIIKPGITILGGLNGSGKSELFRLFLIGMKKAFSVMHSGTMLPLSKCSLTSIRETILYYTSEKPLPVSRLQLYDMNPELAEKLGITQSMANLSRPSKGQHALFLIMWIIMEHGHEQGIVILDEATTNLDHENRERVFSVILECCKGTFIVVDHSVPYDKLDVKLPAPSVPIPL